MAAQIIPFPKLESVSQKQLSKGADVAADAPARVHGSASGLHVVRASAWNRSQQTAQRIVQDVCLEHDLPHPALEKAKERDAAFWATLPIPPARVETPLSVVRRLASAILPMVEQA